MAAVKFFSEFEINGQIVSGCHCSIRKIGIEVIRAVNETAVCIESRAYGLFKICSHGRIGTAYEFLDKHIRRKSFSTKIGNKQGRNSADHWAGHRRPLKIAGVRLAFSGIFLVNGSGAEYG